MTMADSRQVALDYAQENRERFLKELEELIAIPSISTDVENKPDIQRAADWLAVQLRGIGIENVQVMPTAKHPVVFGEWMGAGENAPIVLIYGHYDVQPVDPIELWKTPPFEPTRQGDNLYGRGASDMKGQIMAALKAVEALLRTGGASVNLKFMIEGEEEIGSPSLDALVLEQKDLLASDFCLNPDAGMISADKPTITYALRGLSYFEVWTYGPDHDLHSGSFGGVVHNPAQALCELIAGMHDEQGRITLPGFYDSVRKLSVEEHQELVRLPMDEQFYLEQTGVPALWGEAEFLPIERVGARPTLEVNGLLSGWTSEGQKTVLPAKAMAKISTRLVPDQSPEQVHQQLVAYMEAHAPKDIRWEVKELVSNPPAFADRNTPEVQALSRALESVWGRRPYYRREGGSIPVVELFQRVLGIESALTGFSLPDDNLHAPNEKLHLPTWYRGIDTLIHFFYNLKG
jgi:acetylornithine deacetylase/succinyl-diaminopimelate desuccinylase-like protein